MRTLVLTTDSFGGHGGLSQYNRDFITAMCSYPAMTEVVVLPRLVAGQIEPLPSKVTFVHRAAGSKPRFVAAMTRALMGASPFDLVIGAHINVLPLAAAAAWRYGAPLILWIYGIDAWTRPANLLSGRACGWIDGFASISRVTAERFRSWAPLKDAREWIVPNAVDLERFSPSPRDPDLVERYRLRGKTVIATLARLAATERLKGVDEVLEVMPRMLGDRPHLIYLVMGDGSDKERLEQKAASLGVANHVVFTGRIAEHEKVAHYRLADAFVMPSRGEGFGFVFLEALACGVPVVASAVDGGREAVREGELGELVDPRDPDDIVRGIDASLSKPKGAVPPGLSYFSRENFVSRVHALIDDVMRS